MEKLAKVDPRLKAGYTERMEPEQRVTETLQKLIALAEQGSQLSKEELFDSLWYDSRKRDVHTERRIGYGHIRDKGEYMDQTFSALSGASIVRMAGDGYVEIELDDQKWSIVLNQNGQIKTAYPHDDRFPSFSENLKNRGYEVYETTIIERIRGLLKRLFGSL